MARRAPLVLITLGLLLRAAPAAAGCNSFPFDALCGSFVQSGGVSGNSSVVSLHYDAAPTLADQSLGPAYTERLADPLNVNGEGNVTHESASERIAIDEGVLAIEMGTDSDAHDFGLSVSAGAASRIVYDEELAVDSGALPPSTDVTVRLRYRIAYGAALAHSLGEAIVATFNYQQQYADVQMEATASLDNHSGSSDFDQSFWNVFYGLNSSITGAFANPGQLGEVVATVQTGHNLHLHIYLNGGAGSQASEYGQFAPYVFPTAASGGTVAMVFGIEADEPGVTITSPAFGALPGFTGVTSANALANAIPVDVGGPVSVPEPGAVAAETLAGVSVLFLGLWRERRLG